MRTELFNLHLSLSWFSSSQSPSTADTWHIDGWQRIFWSAAMTGFDLIKLVILIWFLAPFGYNASDMIFDLVSVKLWGENLHDNPNLFPDCHPHHWLPQSHAGSANGPGLVPVPVLPRIPPHLRRLSWFYWNVKIYHYPISFYYKHIIRYWKLYYVSVRVSR